MVQASEGYDSFIETWFTHHAVHLVQVVSVHSQTATCSPEHFHRPDPLTPQALTSAHLPSVCVKHPLCTVHINRVRQLWPRGWLVQHACSKDPPSCVTASPLSLPGSLSGSLTYPAVGLWGCPCGSFYHCRTRVEEEAWRVGVSVESVRPGGALGEGVL